MNKFLLVMFIFFIIACLGTPVIAYIYEDYSISDFLITLSQVGVLVMMWANLCAERATEERGAIQSEMTNEYLVNHNEMALHLQMPRYQTHVWHRMTLRSPWKLYKFQ